MVITISGDIGSGKSTVGRMLVQKLDYKYLSTGGIQRQIAREMGLTTLQLNVLSEKSSDIDDRIDAHTIAISEAPDNYVVDSRLAWHFIPSSFKVYLQCSTEEAARRISLDSSRLGEKKETNVRNLLDKILDRRASEKRRFLQKYNVDYTLLHQYDIVVNTTSISPETVMDEVLRHFKDWQLF